ncbi:MAG: hypothetical protein GY838_02555 [bacterium]|nr:hypothetical protein [bacterium]
MKRTLMELAELADRLRRFRSGDGTSPPPGVERLAVAGRLVARLGHEREHADATALGETATALAHSARRASLAVDRRLLALLDALADLLEDLLGAVDEGADPTRFLDRRDWPRFRPDHAGSPPAEGDPAAGPVLLLVASVFRRAALEDRFAAANIPCETVIEPAAVVTRLQRSPRPRWVVCDDQEPERHLNRLREQLGGAGDLPPLVLLVPGGTPKENLAARRGADHLWYEPFDPADLPIRGR